MILSAQDPVILGENHSGPLSGYKRVEWDNKNERGEEVASGMYFYRIKASDSRDSKKMVILK
jgi:flagellar hook assembly protein FlgD